MRHARRDPQRLTLRDGSEVFVRPVRCEDKDRLAVLTDGLSEESRSRRYLGPKGRLSRAELRYLTEVDHRDHEALLALDHPTGAAIGVARYIRHLAHSQSAEVAVVVSDSWQRHGVAKTLVSRLAAHAHAHGVRRFTAITFADNRASLTVLKQLGTCRVTHEGDGTATVDVDLRSAGWVPRALHRIANRLFRRKGSSPPATIYD
jgi:RimJ/RimL family protein N-acetyltransferase